MISSFIVSRDVQLPAATCRAVLPRQSVANKAEGWSFIISLSSVIGGSFLTIAWSNVMPIVVVVG